MATGIWTVTGRISHRKAKCISMGCRLARTWWTTPHFCCDATGRQQPNCRDHVYNSDGQDSTFTNPTPPDIHVILQLATPQVTFSPSTLPAGAEAEIDIEGVNTDFVSGVTTVGYGSSDVLVRGLWVLSPTHALANVQFARRATRDDCGDGAVWLPDCSQPSRCKLPAPIRAAGGGPSSGKRGLGAERGISRRDRKPDRREPGGTQTSITIKGQPANISQCHTDPSQFRGAAGFKPGLQILKLNNGTMNAYPMVITIVSTPPVITGFRTRPG